MITVTLLTRNIHKASNIIIQKVKTVVVCQGNDCSFLISHLLRLKIGCL